MRTQTYLSAAVNQEIDEWLLEYEDDLLMIENAIMKTGSIKGESLADWITEDRMSYDV